MSIFDEAARYAANFQLSQPQRRNYPLGDPGIPTSYRHWGVDKDRYSPEFYGEYPLKSNPVYACITMRAAWAASLPLRLLKYSAEASDLSITRTDPDSLEARILKRLDSLRPFKRAIKPYVRNVVATLGGARSPIDLIAHQRRLGTEEINTGPIFELLQHVNPFWTLNRLLRMTQMARDIWGEAYWFIERGENGRGAPQEIWWVKPTQVRPIPDGRNYLAGYWYIPVEGGEWLPFSTSEVIRIYNPNPNDEWQPMSPIAAARIYADHENASMQANKRLHDQGLHPGAIITPKGDTRWSPEQALKVEDDINERLSGVSRAHRWGVFRHEVDIHTEGISPKDSEYILGMEHDVQMVANAFHWPIDLLGGKRTYENIDQAMKQAWQTIVLENAFLAAEIVEQLFPMFRRPEADIAFFDHTGVAVLQESETKRWEREKSQVDVVVTRNEWRADRGLPPVDGGDRLFVSNQQTPLHNPYFVTGPGDEGTPLSELEAGQNGTDGELVAQGEGSQNGIER